MEKWGEDTSSRVLVWHEGDIGYSVSMILAEAGDQSPLTVYSAVWKDDEENLRRASIQLPEELIDTPIKVENFGMKVNNLIDALYQQSGLLEESPLPNSVLISTLSPH